MKLKNINNNKFKLVTETYCSYIAELTKKKILKITTNTIIE